MKDSFSDVGNRILLQLNAQGMKQAELCRLTGLSANSISQYVNNQRVPDNMATYKIAKALHVTMEWLLTGENPSALDLDSSKLADFLFCFSRLTLRDQNEIIEIMKIKLASHPKGRSYLSKAGKSDTGTGNSSSGIA